MQSKERIISDLTDKTLQGVKFVVENYGDRNPCSDGESRCQDFLSDELVRKFGGKTEKKSGDVSPYAYFGTIPFCVILAIVSLLLYFAIPVVSMLFLAIGFITLIMQNVFNVNFIDGFTFIKKANNVVWTDGNDSAAKRIYLTCHLDSTFERRLKYKHGTRVYAAVLFLSIIGGLYLFVISTIYTVDHFSVSFDFTESIILSLGKTDIFLYDFFGYLTLLFLPEWISLFFFKNKSYVTQGVSDNLTAAVCALNVVEAVKTLYGDLKNTSIGVVFLCAGTCGNRGAKNFALWKRAELKGKDVYFIDVENIKDKKWLQVSTRDGFDFIPSDDELLQTVLSCAKQNGIPISKTPYPFMHSDGGILARSGFKCVTVSSDSVFNEDRHTRRDNVHNISRSTVSSVITLLSSVIREIDEKEKKAD